MNLLHHLKKLESKHKIEQIVCLSKTSKLAIHTYTPKTIFIHVIHSDFLSIIYKQIVHIFTMQLLLMK